MAWNPFEDDAATEEPSQEPEQSEPTVVQTADPGEVSLTVKAGSGYNAPWITMRRPTLQGLENDLQNETLERVLTWSAAVSQQYSKKFEGSNGSSKSNGGGSGQPGKPAKATQAPNGESHTCHCGGDMTYVSGFSQKTEKPYAFFACPKPMGQQCQGSNGKNYTINYEGPKS